MKKINNINYSKFVKTIKKIGNTISIETIFGQVLQVQIQELEFKNAEIGDILEYEGKIYLVKSKEGCQLLVLSGNREFVLSKVEDSWKIKDPSYTSEEITRALRVSVRQGIPFKKALKIIHDPIKVTDGEKIKPIVIKKKKKLSRVKKLMIKHKLDSDIASDVIKYNDPIENALKRQKERDKECQLKKIDLLDSGKVVPGSYGTGKRR